MGDTLECPGVQLCGGMAVELGGKRIDPELSGRRARLCLAYLALNRERPVRRDELIEALWQDGAPDNPEAALATVISRLRAALGHDVVQGRGELHLVLPEGDCVDIELAAAAIEAASTALANGDPERAIEEAERGLALLRGGLLPGLEAPWIDDRRREVEDVRLQGLEIVAEAALQTGHPRLARAEQTAREYVRCAPYRESAHALLMRVLRARDNTAEALQVYEDARVRLRDELGTVPGRALTELHRELLEGSHARLRTGTVSVVVAQLDGLVDIAGDAGEDAAAHARATCKGVLRDAARATEGALVSETGDGLTLAFGSSLNALACAALMQQGIANHARMSPERAATVRVGVNVGELGDGGLESESAAAGVASQLCARAGAGQILVSELVRSLAGTRGAHEFLDAGPFTDEDEGRRAYELQWRTGEDADVAGDDPGGAQITPIAPDDVDELERVLALSGLEDVSLSERYSVVFAYPGMGVGDLHRELAGCTTQVCAIIEATADFERHGIQVAGISTEPSMPPAGCREITFPAGLLPREAVGGIVPVAPTAPPHYAARTSFVVFPDRTGIRISGVSDVIAHVRKTLDLAMRHRLDTYRRATISYLADSGSLASSIELRDLLTPGADSVAIPRVELKLELVAKIADPDVVAVEAGYIGRINRLFEEHDLERLFPAVVAVSTGENPGWYLMEAGSPVTLDQLLFADRERTQLREDRADLLADSLQRISKLYELTYRAETPAVSEYHYLGRFLAIPEREDARQTFASLVGDGTLEDMLQRSMRLNDGFECRSYRDQVDFLAASAERLLEPVGAYIHGDFHLPNMLLDQDGGRIVLIDPRVVWDGHDVGDPGFCDPVYDPATLLQSLHLAAPMLRALADGESASLLSVDYGNASEPLLVRDGILKLHENATVGWFSDWVERAMPARVRGETWRARLHIGAANACLGWLKYERSLQTRDGWFATFASVLYHLEIGRRALEGGQS